MGRSALQINVKGRVSIELPMKPVKRRRFRNCRNMKDTGPFSWVRPTALDLEPLGQLYRIDRGYTRKHEK